MVCWTMIGGPGICDPCEKLPTDVLRNLTQQVREDMTNSAQVDV